MSEEKDPFEKMAVVEETFKSIFKDALHVETKVVKTGGTSSNVYVNKKYGGHPITLIIWDKVLEVDDEVKLPGDIEVTQKEEVKENDNRSNANKGESNGENRTEPGPQFTEADSYF